MKFVCSAFDTMPPELMPFSRLYAFPHIPDAPPGDGFVLLDSGAFALSMRGRRIDEPHMHRLAGYYRAHANERVYGIAPDVYPDPYATMKNYTTWLHLFGVPVVPVIQMPGKRTIDLTVALKQIKFYANQRELLPRFQDKYFIALSNPALRGCEAQELKHVGLFSRRLIGPCWIHVLGAGWDVTDLRDWRRLNVFDSLDTIAYYTDAQAGQYWGGGSADAGFDWKSIAIENAITARETIHV